MNNVPPSFTQVLSSRLFVMPRGADDIGWCAYLLGRTATPPDEPITIPQSFNNFSGSYLFALEAPSLTTEQEVTAFIGAVRDFLDNCFKPQGAQHFTGRACLWIPDVKGPAFGLCGSTAFTFERGLNAVTVQSNFNNVIGAQITLSVARNALMRVYDEGLQISREGSQAVSFSTRQSGRGPTIDQTQVFIPFSGPYSGSFLVTGTLSTATTLSFLNEGVRYVHGSQNGSSDTAQIYPVVTTDQNVNVPYVGAVDPLDPVNAHRTPEQLNAGRLRTLWTPISDGDAASHLPSFLRTSANKAVSLVPQGGGSPETGPAAQAGSLVFTFEEPEEEAKSNLVLTLAGDFGLAVEGAPASGAGAGATFDLLCGLFGSETMSFRAFATSASFDRLRFLPRQNAYAPVFPFDKVSLNNPSSGAVSDRLTDTFVTSWAMMINGDGGDVRYMAQPESSPLYAVNGDSRHTVAVGDGTQEIIVLGTFDPSTKLKYTPGFAVPLAPYAGLTVTGDAGSFAQDDLSLFESEIIAPTRKNLIAASVKTEMRALKDVRLSALRAGQDPGTTRSTTTPQGLLAEVAEGTIGVDYVQVTLAQSEVPEGRSPEMAFCNLQIELQNLFQTNQLFSVVVNPQFLGDLRQDVFSCTDTATPSFKNTVTIAEWTMDAVVGDGVSATDYRNVLIFKFGEGTVEERVKNPKKWIDTKDFSIIKDVGDDDLALVGLSQWLQDYINNAVVEADVRNNTLYKNFARTVRDPNWNGILVLRAQIPAQNFPDQIKGLAAGIDFTQFEAHHFGVTVSRVAITGEDITIDGTSSLFGLIDYQLPLFRQNIASGGNPDVPLGIPVDGPYGFTVLQLQVLFQNAALVDFRSRVQLTVNDLFGSAVTQTYVGGTPLAANGVVLKGTYQRQGTTATYVFEENTQTIFEVNSNIFNSIALNRVQFNTLTAGNDDNTIRSRFLLWGAFDFVVLKDNQNTPESFDILSFGSKTGTVPANSGIGLAFSNLQVNLSSPAQAPNAVTFSFDPQGLAFDLGNSQPRDGSLFSTFALQLDSFIASPGDKRPSDFGYLPVRVGVRLTEIDGPWFGVVYKVTMGTPGALVSNVGFESRMLLAWSAQTTPSDTDVAVFTGLQLPGAAPGAKLLSLQGVLKVSIDSIQLLYETVSGSSQKAFTLRLSNIGLKFLGIAKLPPGATINFFLFGDPSGKGSLGWYAAFIKDQESSAETLVSLDDPDALDLLEAPSETEEEGA